MIALPPGARVWLAGGVTDMKGMNGLTLLVQEGLGRDPHAGDPFVFRGRRAFRSTPSASSTGVRRAVLPLEGPLIRLTIWPAPADGAVAISAAQLGYLLDGIDRRNARRTWRPAAAG